MFIFKISIWKPFWANLNLSNIDYSLVLKEYDLINWLKYVLDEKNQVADDIILESVLLAGTAAMDDQCAKLLAKVSEGLALLAICVGWIIMVMTHFRRILFNSLLIYWKQNRKTTSLFVKLFMFFIKWYFTIVRGNYS